MVYVALVTDRAGSFATVLRQPVLRFLEGEPDLIASLS
jgi:hypothetical protein